VNDSAKRKAKTANTGLNIGSLTVYKNENSNAYSPKKPIVKAESGRDNMQSLSPEPYSSNKKDSD
jgi:hypothetical protein